MHPEEPNLPLDLERQLAAIERSANILPPHVLVEDVFDLPPVPRRTHRNSPTRHALSAELRRSLREAERVRRLGLLFILAGVLASTFGALLLRLDHSLAGIAVLLIGGLLIGFSSVSLFKATQRVHASEGAFARLDKMAVAPGDPSRN